MNSASTTAVSQRAISGTANLSTSRPSVKLVMVHGTGAGHVDDIGERWWQRESELQKQLTMLLCLDSTSVEFIAFHWTEGPNSESARRAAGAELYTTLKAFDRQDQDYFLVGHSHGGSVIYNALIDSVIRRDPLQRLKQWCTVGTPFLDYNPNRHLFNRTTILGKSLYMLAIGIVLLALIMIASPLYVGVTKWGADKAILFGSNVGFALYLCTILSIAAVLIGLLFAFDRYWGGWRTTWQKREVCRLYEQGWLGLWHRDDEAISALTNVKSLSGPIVPTTFLVPIFSAIPLFAIAALILLMFFYDPVVALQRLPVWLQPPSITDKWEAALKNNTTADFVVQLLIPSVAALGALFIVTVAAIFMLETLAKFVGAPLARAIDQLVWASVRQQAWGDDRQREGVGAISAHPPLFAMQFGPLPDEIGRELSEFSDKNAISTLKKVRELLGMSAAAQQSADVRAELGRTLSWRELIHTSYFEVPRFVRLLAFSLHRAGLGELSPGHWPQSDHAEAEAGLDAILGDPKQRMQRNRN